jgi:[protein-PII] uridylyltransferase
MAESSQKTANSAADGSTFSVGSTNLSDSRFRKIDPRRDRTIPSDAAVDVPGAPPCDRRVTAITMAAPAFTRLDAARQELSAQAARGDAGRVALERFSDRVDALVRQLATDAPPPASPASVFAMGGYGRRQLCLHSDIDLLVLFAGSIAAADEQFLRRLLHPLWDQGLDVSHQVRELQDLAHVDTTNPTFLLALVDARPIAASAAHVDAVDAYLAAPSLRACIVEALARLIEERHAAFNHTPYQLEPDVKDAPGTLRDLMALRTMARLSDPALLDRAPADRATLDEAEDFLLRLRSILHLEAGRNQNRLSHEMQEHAARVLRYPGATPQQQVERLMSDYFRHARSISRTFDWTRRMAPRPVGRNLVCSSDGVRFVDTARARVEPAGWLQAFQAALDAGAPVADEALSLIQQHADRYVAEDFFATPEDREAIVRFLHPRPGLYARLSEMHDCGLLGRMFPEFAAISCRVVRDFYHKYTVDEHTLLTIRNLERLAAPGAGRERFAALLDVPSPALLVLSLLFHDVGKWRDQEHASESVRMARQVLERLQLASDDRELVEFLISNHLRMSVTAFRRDTEDPEIVRQFAELVGIEERLKMLCLMTLVDIEAVSPETLTPWREELLWRLYVDTYNQLTLGYGDELIDRSQTGVSELLAERPPHVSEQAIRQFVEGLPRRYLRLFTPAAVYQHVQLAHDIQPDHIHAALERNGDTWELTVVTLDKPFLFSNICGVLSSFGMDILRGQAMTNPNGLVLDHFEFADREQFLALNPDARTHFLRALEAVVSGELDVAERLRAREQSVVHRRSGIPRFAPVIHCDNHSSRRYTILDIIANNAVGLLHRISRMMSSHGCHIDLVLIGTEGEKAIDVFHITVDGAKLTDAGQAALAADLTRMLEDNDEVDQGDRPAQ